MSAADWPATVRAWLNAWCPRLGLQDYRLRVDVVHPSAFPDNNTLGDCDAWRTKRRADIRLLEPGHAGEDADDLETVLVHELLHLVLPMVLFQVQPDADDLRYRLYEQGIDRLARTLVDLSRQPPSAAVVVPDVLRLRLHRLVADWRVLTQKPQRLKTSRLSRIAAIAVCAAELENVLNSEE